jgi:hypothetical protein
MIDDMQVRHEKPCCLDRLQQASGIEDVVVHGPVRYVCPTPSLEGLRGPR